MAFNEMEVEAFEGIAKRLADEVDVTFFIETYAANPDLAGEALKDLLSSLPIAPESKSQKKVDAFVGLALIQHTHEALSTILGDDMYLQEQLDQHHKSDVDISGSLPSDTPSQKEVDRDIRESSRGQDSAADADRDIRRESTKNDDVVHDSFQQALSRNEDNSDDGEEEEFSLDFSVLDPYSTFRESTRTLVEQIMHTALSHKRLQPLYEHGYTTEDQVDALCRSLRFMVSQLRFSTGDPDDEEDDDDDDHDDGESWID